MINVLQKLLYNGGAFSILFLEMAVILIIQGEYDYKVFILFTLGIILGGYQYWLIQICRRNLELIYIQVDTVSERDRIASCFSYISYALPMVKFFFSGINVYYLVGGSICVILMFMFMRINGVADNPVLLLLGYHLYAVKLTTGVSDCTLISKRVIRNANQIRRVHRMCDYLYLEGD